MRIAIGCLLFLSMAACGGGSGSDEGRDLGDITNDAPACSSVWVEGKTIPDDYDGCLRDDDVFEAGVSVPCASGSPIFTYEPEGSGFFTGADGLIVEAGEDYANDPRYSQRFKECN